MHMLCYLNSNHDFLQVLAGLHNIFLTVLAKLPSLKMFAGGASKLGHVTVLAVLVFVSVPAAQESVLAIINIKLKMFAGCASKLEQVTILAVLLFVSAPAAQEYCNANLCISIM
jgi:hypothetical protein